MDTRRRKRGRRRTAPPLVVGLALGALALLLGNTGCGCGSDRDIGTNPILVECPPIDIVFVMDTSGSMSDEGVALCNVISAVEADLVTQGATVSSVSLLGIDEPTPPGTLGGFPCLTDNVENLYGATVPGSPPPGIATLGNSEDWASATSIIAAAHPWTPGSLRVIVPISDEGARNGNPCNDPGDDRDAVTHAITVATANTVIVSPIAGTGSSGCVLTLGADLAAGTGGTASESTDPSTDIATIIFDLVVAACSAVP